MEFAVRIRWEATKKQVKNKKKGTKNRWIHGKLLTRTKKKCKIVVCVRMRFLHADAPRGLTLFPKGTEKTIQTEAMLRMRDTNNL